MSFDLVHAAWKLDGMPPTKKLVLINLADRANKNGVCWPKVKTISEDTGLSSRAVREALRFLEEDGALTRTNRINQDGNFTSNLYHVTPTQSRHPARPSHGTAGDAVGDAVDAARTAGDAVGGGTSRSSPMREVQQGGAGSAHLNHQENHHWNLQQNRQTNQESSGSGSRVLPAAPAAPDATASVFDHWRTVMKHPQARLDPKRTKAIREAIKLGYTTEQLLTAVDGCASSAWHMGGNDRHTVYDGLDLILRDAAHIDKFIALATKAPPTMSAVAMQNAETARRWLAQSEHDSDDELASETEPAHARH